MKALYLFSIPRSGSTLLQRVLSTSENIATATEPWTLLPLLYALREKGCVAEYGHWTLSQATEDFCSTLPEGRQDYLDAAGNFAMSLYRKSATDGASYFLDKTPRYHLVIDDIVKMLPEAKFVLLWRNPLAVAASMIETWSSGKWNLHHFHIDLRQGLENLLCAHRQHSDRFIVVKYEDLVQAPQAQCQRLCDELGIPFRSEMCRALSGEDLTGRLGDPTGRYDYDDISRDSIDKWKNTFCNPLRRTWARGYLNWIGAANLAEMGYDFGSLSKALDECSGYLRKTASDALRMPYGYARRKVWQRRLNTKWP